MFRTFSDNLKPVNEFRIIIKDLDEDEARRLVEILDARNTPFQLTQQSHFEKVEEGE